jgi:predicted TIM-barrel fold metal-dependent hydrolase
MSLGKMQSVTYGRIKEMEMTTRRGFIKESAGAAAGIVFTGCGLLGAAPTRAQPAAKRREVVVAGKRVKTIDTHAHCVIPEAMSIMGLKIDPAMLDMVRDRTPIMDAQGIDIEALSINPLWYRLDRDRAAQVVKIQNEKLAEICASKPDRFVAYASLALQFPDLAVQQLEEAVKKMGFRGAAIGGNVAGDEFAIQKFHPVWAKAEELGVLLFIHPGGVPELNNRLKGNGVLENVIGNPLDTTIALSHLIFQGTLDRFPGLKVLAAHGGGYLASYADRSDHGCLTFPERCDPSIKLKKKPTEYLNQLYFDTLIFGNEALRHLAAQVGASQLVLGTDYPFPWQDKGVDHILNAPGFTDAQKAAMLSGTAAKLLGIKS